MTKKNNRWRPKKYTAMEFAEKFVEYLSFCKETIINRWIAWITTKPLTISWFCLFAWVSREYLSEKSKNPEFSDTIKEIRMMIENDVEEKALLWIYSPTASSFNLKNNFGWKEKNETELIGNIVLEWEDEKIYKKILKNNLK